MLGSLNNRETHVRKSKEIKLSSSEKVTKKEILQPPKQLKSLLHLVPKVPFQTKTEEFLSSISQSESDTKKIRNEIVKLVLQIQEGMGSNNLRRITFRLNCLDEFTFFKNQYLDMSAYLNRLLWVAVIEKYNHGITPENEVLSQDVDYCIDSLLPQDLLKLKSKEFNTQLDLSNIDLAVMTTGKNKQRDIQTYVQSKSYTLNFLAEFDPGIAIEDLEQDLACEYVRVFNTYSRSRGKNINKSEDVSKASTEKKFQMYSEMAVNNKVKNLKEYYTCESRRRVATTDQELYNERNRLRKHVFKTAKTYLSPEEIDSLKREVSLGRDIDKSLREKILTGQDQLDSLIELQRTIRASDVDYFSTTASLVRIDSSDEERVIDIADTKGGGLEYDERNLLADSYTETSVWVESLCERVDDRIAKFVKIVTGHHNQEFETWAENSGVNTEKFDQMVKAARTFCGVQKDELQYNEIIQEALEDHLKPHQRY
jgi:hypothetical protein